MIFQALFDGREALLDSETGQVAILPERYRLLQGARGLCGALCLSNGQPVAWESLGVLRDVRVTLRKVEHEEPLRRWWALATQPVATWSGQILAPTLTLHRPPLSIPLHVKDRRTAGAVSERLKRIYEDLAADLDAGADIALTEFFQAVRDTRFELMERWGLCGVVASTRDGGNFEDFERAKREAELADLETLAVNTAGESVRNAKEELEMRTGLRDRPLSEELRSLAGEIGAPQGFNQAYAGQKVSYADTIWTLQGGWVDAPSGRQMLATGAAGETGWLPFEDLHLPDVRETLSGQVGAFRGACRRLWLTVLGALFGEDLLTQRNAEASQRCSQALREAESIRGTVMSTDGPPGPGTQIPGGVSHPPHARPVPDRKVQDERHRQHMNQLRGAAEERTGQ